MALVPISHSSSSMATAQPCFSYDVFLSFRGEDTRKNFTDHLYTALKQAGIHTFRDVDAMERGKLLKPELEKAIKQSAISVIVFSEGYASSKWCLDEVLAIIKEHETSSSKHEVVPVFYKVEPSDVRNQTGSFKEAFDAYEDEIKVETDLEKKTGLLEKLGAWRNSLRKAATFAGMVLGDGYEAKFIIDIVNVIRKKLDYTALYIEEKLVGITNNVAKIESWLQDPSPTAVILLIDGMGGVGKTTIAKCIFNSNSRNYDGSCFLANINETSNQPDGLLRLQSQLLSTILKSEKEETIWNVHEGIQKVTNSIFNKRVLVILDDVTTLQQLEALLGPQIFYHGSKVIITTRHKELSTAFKVHPKVQSLKMLSMGDAIELFSSYAFDQDRPIEPYIVQSKLFVRYCGGLPLALKVLASSLRGNANDVWEDTMSKLKAIPNPEIDKVLEISYETLTDDKDKDLFLHVACFFVGEKKDYIVKLLAECDLYPVVGIKNLMDTCLLYVEDGRVRMHQLIMEMGREVVRKESKKEPGKRSRLWHHQDCIDVLQDQSGTEKVRGLMIVMPEMREAKSTRSNRKYLGKRVHENNVNFKLGALENMKNLMLLQLDYVTFSGKCKRLPRKLRLLSWHGFTLKSIPADIPIEKLVVLDMSYSKLTHVWDDFKFIGSLKILNLSYSVELTKTPDFRGLPSLESLILKGCSSLIKVHESISYLKELVLLDLTNCTNLREFPCIPKSVASLHLSGCSSLIKVHESISYLKELVLLDLTNCTNLREFPCFPKSVASLHLSGCSKIGVVEWVRCLDSRSLPSALVLMNLSDCNLCDNVFPNDWSSLVSLKGLKIADNYITSLPKCIQTLPTIQDLFVAGCSKIQSVQYLPQSLKTLYLLNNNSLEKVQLAHSSRIEVYQDCEETFYELVGRYKFRTIDKVERKIIQYLGLESDAGEGLDLGGLKVLHEFGIFSSCVKENQIPSGYKFKERGPQISFEVPWKQNCSKIIGFNMCVVLSPSLCFAPAPWDKCYYLKVEVYNKTKDLTWIYHNGHLYAHEYVKKFAWLSVWRCGNLLEAGDEIVISIIDGTAHEYRINLIYEDDKQLDGEIHEDDNVNGLDQILWTDKMHKNISDYVHNGKTYRFQTDYQLRSWNIVVLIACTLWFLMN